MAGRPRPRGHVRGDIWALGFAGLESLSQRGSDFEGELQIWEHSPRLSNLHCYFREHVKLSIPPRDEWI